MVRSIDIAHYMNFSKPSVSRAMGLLRENNHITMDEDRWITLTEDGRAIAECIYERHRLMTEWLIALGVSPAVAAEDACGLSMILVKRPFKK